MSPSPAPGASHPPGSGGEHATRVESLLADLQQRAVAAFAENQLIQSLPAYLAELAQEPLLHTRSAARYLLDMIEHFGSEPVEGIGRHLQRYRVFDGRADGAAHPLIGQEEVVEELVARLRAFALAGRADKLIVLHGPNGSAKSTIVALLMEGLEAYSNQPAGALYRCNWIFPTHDETTAALGFPTGGRRDGRDATATTFAHLSPDEIASRLSCELKCPPYLMVPAALRRGLFTRLCEDAAARAVSPDAAVALRHHLLAPELLRRDLCAKCKAVFDALAAAYQGDLARLWRHVQVERFYISKRFRTSAVVVEPQLQNVDAWVRQITGDRSLQYLPAALQNLPLREPGGDLIDANRGLLEYSDLLKRPREAYKYLLVTSEQGVLNLPDMIAYLDVVLMATVNELHLGEFKRIERNPDYVSFKARMDFVAAPYLLRTSQEERVYLGQLSGVTRDLHVAPHTLRLSALWAVLTRLRRPQPEHYPRGLQSLIARVDPLTKARLYDNPAAGLDGFRPEEQRSLRTVLAAMRHEFSDTDDYEGCHGASVREMKSLLQEAAIRNDDPCVTPLDVFDELRELCSRLSTYEFLQLEPEELAYRDPKALIELVEAEYLRTLAHEVQSAMELVSPDECERLFNQYIAQVLAYTTGNKVTNPVTGASEPPDEKLMQRVEEVLKPAEPVKRFRHSLGGQLGAYALEHPGGPIVYADAFPQLIATLEQDVYKKKLDIVRRIEAGILVHGHPEFEHLPDKDKKRVESTLAALQTRYGYCLSCARRATIYLTKHELQKAKER